MSLLADVSQPSTQWSVVYGIASGNIDVVMGRRYDERHSLPAVPSGTVTE